MRKSLHASVRIDPEMRAPLKKEAEEKYEGNLSLLIRMILKDYIKKGCRN